MRPARHPTCSKLIYLGSAFMHRAMIIEALRRCHLALVALALLLSIGLGATAQSISQAPIQTTVTKSADIDRRLGDSEVRIKSLIQKMTLTEKIGQLQQVNNVNVDGDTTANHQTEKALNERIRKGQVGSVLNEVDPSNVNRLQTMAVE